MQTRMPVEKQHGKPFTPSLSSNFRSTKSPLTPRLAGAGSGPTTPASGPRREAFVRARSPGKEDQPASLGGNITPRSAARRSRIGTESPSTTPTSTRTNLASPPAQPASAQHGLGIASPLTRGGISLDEVVQSTASPTPLYSGGRRISIARSAVNVPDNDSKFFHANDAKPTQVQAPPKASPDPEAQFFYVGGTATIASPKISPVRATHPSAHDEKFFHASDVRSETQSRPVRPQLARHATTSAVSARSAQTTSTTRTFMRSTSPGKNDLARPRSRGKDDVAVLSTAGPTIDRRGSMESSLSNKGAQLNHKKAMSASSVASTPTRKLSGPRPLLIPTSVEQRLEEVLNTSTNSTGSLTIPTASPETFSTRSPSLGSQISERSLSHAKSINGRPSVDISARSPPVTSPTSNPTTTVSAEPISLPPMSPSLPAVANPADPAAQARRERKVLDLEISNSSLLSINRQLEREIRKQKTELRRFHRLSRSGRLSLPGRNVSSTSTLGILTEEFNDEESSASDAESDDADATDDDLDLLSNSPLGHGETDSPGTAATKRARQRARDEKRLMLDLSKHRQMLLDGQRLSQSIRRCLTCTEELIRDGEKALEYKPEVNVGGRVLNNDDLLETRPGSSGSRLGNASQAEGAKGLLSPGVEITDWLAGGIWVSQGKAGADVAPLGGDESVPDITDDDTG